MTEIKYENAGKIFLDYLSKQRFTLMVLVFQLVNTKICLGIQDLDGVKPGQRFITC